MLSHQENWQSPDGQKVLRRLRECGNRTHLQEFPVKPPLDKVIRTQGPVGGGDEVLSFVLQAREPEAPINEQPDRPHRADRNPGFEPLDHGLGWRGVKLGAHPQFVIDESEAQFGNLGKAAFRCAPEGENNENGRQECRAKTASMIQGVHRLNLALPGRIGGNWKRESAIRVRMNGYGSNEDAVPEKWSQKRHPGEGLFQPANQGKRRNGVVRQLDVEPGGLEKPLVLARESHADVLRELLDEKVAGLHPLHVMGPVRRINPEPAPGFENPSALTEHRHEGRVIDVFHEIDRRDGVNRAVWNGCKVGDISLEPADVLEFQSLTFAFRHLQSLWRCIHADHLARIPRQKEADVTPGRSKFHDRLRRTGTDNGQDVAVSFLVFALRVLEPVMGMQRAVVLGIVEFAFKSHGPGVYGENSRYRKAHPERCAEHPGALRIHAMTHPSPRVLIAGGGFAGVECAFQLAGRGHPVTICEMRPRRMTPAHTSSHLAEMVCSNSFRSDNPLNAVGLLKREMEIVGSIVLSEARRAAVPAGDALAVDRTRFAAGLTERLLSMPEVQFLQSEIESVPSPGDGYCVIATGPLTSPALESSLLTALGEKYLYFYDSVAPIVEAASLDMSKLFAASRWGKGGGDDYLNIPLNRGEYETFVAQILAAETVPLHDFEKAVFFEGCLPIEAMAGRGLETLRHGPMKPFGLTDPRTGREPYAAVQLRQDDLARDHFNIVGFQTKMKQGEQKRVFRTLPGLENAQFARFGYLHRNTFINGPAHLDRFFSWKQNPRIFFGGQLTGVEGYLESAATGLMIGATIAQLLEGKTPEPLPFSTAMGALSRHVSVRKEQDFQPANITFGLIDDSEIPLIRDRSKRREEICRRARESVAAWRDRVLGDSPPVSAADGKTRNEPQE